MRHYFPGRWHGSDSADFVNLSCHGGSNRTGHRSVTANLNARIGEEALDSDSLRVVTQAAGTPVPARGVTRPKKMKEI